jgi:uncharacterized membrane protein
VSLAPLLDAPPVTQVHLAAAILALVAGSAVFAMRKGTGAHVAAGRIFAAAMAAAAITSFGIGDLDPGHFSWIHLLSVLTLVALPWAIIQRRRGHIREHAIGMACSFAGLVAAGLFAFAPARVLGRVLASVL